MDVTKHYQLTILTGKNIRSSSIQEFAKIESWLRVKDLFDIITQGVDFYKFHKIYWFLYIDLEFSVFKVSFPYEYPKFRNSLQIFFIYLFIYLFIYFLFICLFIYLSIYLFIYLFIHLFI